MVITRTSCSSQGLVKLDSLSSLRGLWIALVTRESILARLLSTSRLLTSSRTLIQRKTKATLDLALLLLCELPRGAIVVLAKACRCVYTSVGNLRQAPETACSFRHPFVPLGRVSETKRVELVAKHRKTALVNDNEKGEVSCVRLCTLLPVEGRQ